MTTNNQPSKSGKYLDADTWDAMKAAGFSEAELEKDQPEGPMIFSYTRRMAIEDGVLVDLMQAPTPDEPDRDDLAALVREAGFRFPVAMTIGAFGETVSHLGEELPTGQSAKGRLWDVLWMAKLAIAKSLAKGDTDRAYFKVSVDRGNGRSDIVDLWIHVGPGDTPEPVLTIMLLGED
jgi:hypothetical protein